jgi:hypothetical protein
LRCSAIAWVIALDGSPVPIQASADELKLDGAECTDVIVPTAIKISSRISGLLARACIGSCRATPLLPLQIFPHVFLAGDPEAFGLLMNSRGLWRNIQVTALRRTSLSLDAQRIYRFGMPEASSSSSRVTFLANARGADLELDQLGTTQTVADGQCYSCADHDQLICSIEQ